MRGEEIEWNIRPYLQIVEDSNNQGRENKENNNKGNNNQ